MSFETDNLERRVGQTLRGKWTLERLLGAGGMAAVYVARHKIGRRDAIKILHPEVAENKELAARFEQEAHAVNRFRHPGVVSILDIDTAEDGAPFLVMELLEGESLEARRLRGPIDPAEALRLADELLDVLVAAHARDIIHRDIKPDNLFVLPDGRLKVLDFGIARMREGQPRTLHTALGVTIGTLSYMPPEQVAGEAIDGRADLFAVGCTMFEMASNRLPHEGSTEIELMVKMGMIPAPPLASVFPGADRGLCLVVDRALAFAKERRYPDAATMQADVRALRAGQAPPYAAARIAAGDVPNPPESGALPAPLSMPMPMSMPMPPAPTAYETAYRPVTDVGGGAARSVVEVAAVAVPATSIRGGDHRDRLIAAIAVVATLALCLAVVTWRVLRSQGDDVTADTGQLAGAAAPSASITPSDDEPAPSDPPLAVGDTPAPPGNAAPASPPPQGNAAPASPKPQGNAAPASPAPPSNPAPISPAPQANRPPAIPAPPSVQQTTPASHGKGKGKKNKKH